jgi:hypothetical protein
MNIKSDLDLTETILFALFAVKMFAATSRAGIGWALDQSVSAVAPTQKQEQNDLVLPHCAFKGENIWYNPGFSRPTFQQLHRSSHILF